MTAQGTALGTERKKRICPEGAKQEDRVQAKRLIFLPPQLEGDGLDLPRAVPPHPGPLPWGEGGTFPTWLASPRLDW
jgi:hypothetical protein